MNARKRKVLLQLYTNIKKNASSFGSVQTLYKAAKDKKLDITLSDVKKWLSSRDSYTLHRQVKRKFTRNRILVYGIDEQWEIDLADLSSLKENNEGYTFLLTCIDTLSKFAWVEPLRNKTASSIVKAFKNILSKGRKPGRVRSDKGSEFVNNEFQKLLKQEGIDYFSSQNEDIKCAIVERFNRTLKSRMWRYFTDKGTFVWVDILPYLVRNYNNTVHRSIKMKPSDVKDSNEVQVWNNLYPNYETRKQYHIIFKKGDYVRISKFRQKFDKGYVPQWSEEIFKVYKVVAKKPEPLYKISDLKDEPIEGSFYKQELQKIEFKKNRSYKIEKVLDRRQLKQGRKQLFVKWWGYPEKFNQWIDEKDLI